MHALFNIKIEALKSNRKQEWSELTHYINVLFANIECYQRPVDVDDSYG